MVKWWVAAPSGPEKLDDGEPRRSEKTTTIVHLKLRVRSFVDSPHPAAGAGAGMSLWLEPGIISRGTLPSWVMIWRLSSAGGCLSAHTLSSLEELDIRSRGS
ncbi:hypothetical protein EVAR_33342_1 [Eumeta japonica]|uniref:Uncharacterized protein n=1 Tax=Eumeta variegata TaxID=151549 RepID=A0A4C1YLZ6_EUMVA|nr:hypothetical protein EVAR_33342_1 [Eumeta japonica]